MDRFVMKTRTKKRKTKQSFSKTTDFKKLVVSLTIVNDKPSLTIVNNEPSLTIVNEDRRREETDLKGIGTYH